MISLTGRRIRAVSYTHLDVYKRQNQSSPENASLKWETTTQYNVGFDMGFFNNRLSVTLDGYWKKTKDLLLKVSLPYYTGFTSRCV